MRRRCTRLRWNSHQPVPHLQGLNLNNGPRDECPQTPLCPSSLLQPTSLNCFITGYLSSLSKKPLSPPTHMMTTLILILPCPISKDRMRIDNSGIGMTTVWLRLLFE